MEAELRNFLVANYGFNAWRDVLKVQGDLTKRTTGKEKKTGAFSRSDYGMDISVSYNCYVCWIRNIYNCKY